MDRLGTTYHRSKGLPPRNNRRNYEPVSRRCPAKPEASRARTREIPRSNPDVGAPVNKRKGQPKGKSAKAQATAWAEHNKALRQRRSLTITEAAVAIEIWTSLKRDGEPRSMGRPKDASRRSAPRGDSIERQIYEKVQLESDLVGPGGDLHAAVSGWLPCTFYAPLPPLCEAELLELAKEEEARANGVEGNEDGRLLPGFVREDVTQ